jgi:hypothetical protein
MISPPSWPRNARPRSPVGASGICALAALLALAAGSPFCGDETQPSAAADQQEAGPLPTPARDWVAAAAPCDPDSLELSAPRGKVLRSSRLKLRWRARDPGPFQVTISTPDGRPVYQADTYGHELRVLVGSGAGESEAEQIRAGGSYRWGVVPKFVSDASACPTAEFTLLPEVESEEQIARFEAETKELGVGDEGREPAATLALARLYLDGGFDAEAEGLLQGLREKGYEDSAIADLLTGMYRKTGRRLSLAELLAPPREPAPH